ncbi:hypothetical protein BCR22_11890 [Enterococcus plantarum]|uniref:hypothetical protein n=1 Tax=Enterococcus plantarum TaxID=1077675 RepID=UPI00084D0D78|nr:hypothetical protein [Enterococcus plantarum]OEG18066.1 hypothetical protein BCR22_11890 [Enterococcus plantarum]
MNKKMFSMLLLLVFVGVYFTSEEASANVTVYDKENRPVVFPVGKYTNEHVGSGLTWSSGTFLVNPNGQSIFNDSINRIDVPKGYRVIATDDHNFKDTSAWFEHSIFDFGPLGLKNKISSLIVENIANDPKLPVVYEDHGFGGRQQTLNVGDYRKKNLSFGNDRISAIRVPAGYTVRMWDDDKYKDRNYTYFGPTYIPFLNGFNDKVSSLKVRLTGQPI